MARHVVATVDEILPGERKIVEIDGRSIGVFNVGGEFFALRNACPHQGGPLCLGLVGSLIVAARPGEYALSRPGEMLRCPWHGWEFDMRTGQSWFDPTRTRVRSYPAAVAGGAALAEAGLQPGPYVAETYPVSVERQYVLVDLPA